MQKNIRGEMTVRIKQVTLNILIHVLSSKITDIQQHTFFPSRMVDVNISNSRALTNSGVS